MAPRGFNGNPRISRHPAPVRSKLMRVAETRPRRHNCSGSSLSGSSDSRSPDSGKRGGRSLSTACFLRVSSRSSWMSGVLMRPISPVTGVISGLPAGIIETGAPPQGVLRQCECRKTPAPDPGSKKGGALPSTSVFPVRAPLFGDLAVTTRRNGRSGNSPV